MNNPAWPEAQPWENYLLAVAAVVVVLLHRKAMLGRDQAVTEVLMPDEQQPSPTEAGSTAAS